MAVKMRIMKKKTNFRPYSAIIFSGTGIKVVTIDYGSKKHFLIFLKEIKAYNLLKKEEI